MTPKWIEVNDLLNGQHSVNKNMGFKTPMLKSDFCDYSDAYIGVKRTTTVEGTTENEKYVKNM